MTTATRPRWDIPRSFYPLALLTLVGVGLAVYRMVVGLGPTTNLNDHFPWGLWITLDLFLIPIGGAAFTTSLISHFFHDEKYHAVVRPAVLLGLLCYGLTGLILILDLGRWHQFYNFLLPNFMNIHSFLWEVAFCVTFYTLILVLELAPTILEKWSAVETPKRLIERAMMIIAGIGVVLSSMHQSSIGSMFILLRYKLHAIWWTPLLPLLYFMQALFGGLSLALVVITLTQDKMGLPVDRSFVVNKVGKLIRALLVIYLIVLVVGWLVEGELGLLFSSGAYSLLIWAELIIGIFVPLTLLFRFGQRRAGVLWAGVFTIMGVFMDRLIVSWVGLSVPAWATYVPHWMEIMISVGFIAGAFLVYAIVARYFELFPEKH
jgi:Ni/Fe-hydrogenase subunit HybB-like protein